MTPCCGLDVAVFGHTCCPLAARPYEPYPARAIPEPGDPPPPPLVSLTLGQALARIGVLRLRSAGGSP
jgi:hypothetical protein